MRGEEGIREMQGKREREKRAGGRREREKRIKERNKE